MGFLTVLVSAAGAFLSGVGEGDRLGKVGTAFVTSGEGAGEEHQFIAKVARIGMRMVLVFIKKWRSSDGVLVEGACDLG